MVVIFDYVRSVLAFETIQFFLSGLNYMKEFLIEWKLEKFNYNVIVSYLNS